MSDPSFTTCGSRNQPAKFPGVLSRMPAPSRSRLPVWQRFGPCNPVSPDDVDCSAEVTRWVHRCRLEVILTARRDGPAILRQTRRHRGPTVPLVQLHLADDMSDHPGIDQNNEAVGAAAVNLVIEQIQAGQLGVPPLAKTVLVPGSWSGELASALKVDTRQRERAG